MADFESVRVAKRLLREASSGALGTLSSDGEPYVSLVEGVAGADGSIVLLVSVLARHTQNMEKDPRVSFLIVDQDNSIETLAKTRITVSGRVAKTDNPDAHRRFLARHPSSESYVKFRDFGFWQIEFIDAHLIAGFGRIVDLTPNQLLTDLTGAEDLLTSSQGAVDHMNEDRLDAIELYATKLLGDVPGAWRIVSLDPEGCDLMLGRRIRRLEFPQRISTSQALRKTIVALVQKARAGG